MRLKLIAAQAQCGSSSMRLRLNAPMRLSAALAHTPQAFNIQNTINRLEKVYTVRVITLALKKIAASDFSFFYIILVVTSKTLFLKQIRKKSTRP